VDILHPRLVQLRVAAVIWLLSIVANNECRGHASFAALLFGGGFIISLVCDINVDRVTTARQFPIARSIIPPLSRLL
jgi:hypothetical protein